MKKFSIYSFVLTLFVLLFSACEKDRAFPEFKDLEYGAYARTIDGPNGTYGTAFNYFDVAGSFIEFTVEFYDENQGKNVASYSWDVVYNNDKRATVTSVNSSSFGTSPDGLPSATFRFTFQGTLDALGLTIDDVEGGRNFDFLATLTKTDGKVFTRENTADVLEGQPAYKAHFQIRVPIICPSDLGGMYRVETVYAQHDFLPDYPSNIDTVEVKALGNGLYSVTDASGGLYSEGPYVTNYGTTGLPFEFTDACGKITWQGQTDPWQTLNPVAGLVNRVDGSGVITISMVGDVYGEQWTSVYTPL